MVDKSVSKSVDRMKLREYNVNKVAYNKDELYSLVLCRLENTHFNDIRKM